ncbi:TPA: macrolide ABC transporter permease, partial [Streptococcus suis]
QAFLGSSLFQIEAKNLLFELRLVTIVCHCNISLDYVCILPNYTQVLQLNYIRSVIVLALSPALFSLFLSIFNIQFFSIVQRDVDNEFLGRVFGIIFTIAILFMPVGTGFFSVVLNPNNTFNLFIIGGSITLLSLVFGALFKRYNIS